MAINLPNSRQLPGIQSKQRPDQTDQIIAVLGQNPIAQGITAASTALSDVLKRRAELKKQAMQVAALQNASGVNLEGIQDPALAAPLAQAGLKNKMELEETKKKIQGIRDLEIREGLTPGSLGDDPTTARLLLTQRGINQRHEESQSAIEGQRQFQNDLRIEGMKKSVVDKFTADPSVRKAQQSLDSAAQIRELALSGNPIGAAAIPTFSARMAGEVGALTEADKAPFGGSRAIVPRIQAALRQMADGKLTEGNAKFILELTGIIEKRANANMTNLARLRAKQYSKQSKILNEQELFDALNPGGANASGDETPEQRKVRLLQELQGAQ